MNLTIGTATDVGSYNILITNSSGQVIKQATTSQASWQGDANGLMPGTYTISVVNNKDKSPVGTTRFVKL